jgi:hypothetical protein
MDLITADHVTWLLFVLIMAYAIFKEINRWR